MDEQGRPAHHRRGAASGHFRNRLHRWEKADPSLMAGQPGSSKEGGNDERDRMDRRDLESCRRSMAASDPTQTRPSSTRGGMSTSQPVPSGANLVG